jgi:biopolymer transport protein ExbD
VKIPEGPRRAVRIDMVPLLDSIFLLIVFFMWAMLTMVSQRGVALDLPALSTSQSLHDDMLVVSVDNQNTLFFDRVEVDLDRLEALLKLERDKDDPRAVLLRGDQHSDYGRVLSIFDMIRQAGLTKVVLEVERESR